MGSKDACFQYGGVNHNELSPSLCCAILDLGLSVSYSRGFGSVWFGRGFLGFSMKTGRNVLQFNRK